MRGRSLQAETATPIATESAGAYTTWSAVGASANAVPARAAPLATWKATSAVASLTRLLGNALVLYNGWMD
jgi:hypothetical protein